MTPARLIHWLVPRVILSAWLPLTIAGAQAESQAQVRPGVRPETGTETGIDSASILAAKRDLEAIKAVQDARLAPALSVPSQRLAVPELRTESAVAPPPALRMVKPETTGNNWLIDGMAQTERARRENRNLPRSTDASRGSVQTSSDRDLDGREPAAVGSDSWGDRNAIDSRDPFDSRTPRDSRGAASAERNDASSLRAGDERSVPGVSNPLTQFLGDWMTPQDFALLRPSLEKASLGGSVRSGDAGFSLPGATDFAVDSSLKREIPGGFTAATSLPSREPARENPFLATLNPTAFSSPARVAPPPAPPSIGPFPGAGTPVGPTPGSTAVTAPARPSVPEFPKPLQDEKYFKQLKRF